MKLQKGFIFQTGNIIKTSDTNKKKQEMAFDKNATGGNYSPVSPQPRLVNSIHSGFVRGVVPQRISYSHWANGAQNGMISIGQWGVFNHEKGTI